MSLTHTANRAIDKVLADPSTSYWLTMAIHALLQRDPLDAAIDAQVLADLFTARQHAMRMQS